MYTLISKVIVSKYSSETSDTMKNIVRMRNKQPYIINFWMRKKSNFTFGGKWEMV